MKKGYRGLFDCSSFHDQICRGDDKWRTMSTCEVPFKDFLVFLFHSASQHHPVTSAKKLLLQRISKEDLLRHSSKHKAFRMKSSLENGGIASRSLSNTDIPPHLQTNPEPSNNNGKDQLHWLSTTVLIERGVTSSNINPNETSEKDKSTIESRQIILHQSFSRLGPELHTVEGVSTAEGGLSSHRKSSKSTCSCKSNASSVKEILGDPPPNIIRLGTKKERFKKDSSDKSDPSLLRSDPPEESYPEIAAALLVNNDNKGKNRKGSSPPKSNDGGTEEDLTRDNVRNDYLMVPNTRTSDLSFYKNFSATTRSKSSMLEEYISFCKFDESNHEPHKSYECNNNNKRVTRNDEAQPVMSKRLSRSTPIRLDMIHNNYSLPCSNNDSGLTEEEERLLSHHHQQIQKFLKSNELYQLSPDEEDRLLSSGDFLNDDIEDNGNGYSQSLESNEEFPGDSPIPLETLDDFNLIVVSGKVRSRRKGGSSDSTRPASETALTLPGRSENKNEGGEVVNNSTRRINTSPSPVGEASGIVPRRKRSVSSPEGKRSKSSPGDVSSSTTTVTVTMDHTSLFLDTVYVNVKQNIDAASSIKLYY